MTTRLTQESLARYVPDLWRYGIRLCSSEENARGLICDTLDMAIQKQWKRPASLALESWLNMLMYRVFLAEYSKYGLGKEEGTTTAAPFRQTMMSFETVH